MNKRSLGSLIALNAALLVALIVAGIPGSVQAQGARARGEYTMISADAAGYGNRQILYVTEVRTGKIAVATFDTTRKEVEWLAGRDISQDLLQLQNNPTPR